MSRYRTVERPKRARPLVARRRSTRGGRRYFSVGNPAAGVFSNGIEGLGAVVLSVPASFPLDVPPAGRGAGTSAFPRMTGSPSLPLPMTTTFEFVDCDS